MKATRHLVLILVLAAAGCQRGHVCAYPNSAVCGNSLRMLDAVKQQWYLEERKTTNDVPVMADLAKYMKAVPVCPDGGTYTLGPVWKDPTCSIKGHELPPWRATPLITNYHSSSAINQLPPLNAH
jgi:hypothetical protein